MPFIVVGRERFPLPIGETRLGGGSLEDPVPVPLPTTHATLALMPDRTASLRREGSSPVSVNGVRLADQPVVLRHGDRIQAGAILMVVGDIGPTA